jgi:predicted HAD superfamily hydrolase
VPSKLENYFILSEPCPLINDMKAIIQMNTIKNNPVTTEDINITEKMFGPDISSLKGKLLTASQYQSSKTTLRFLEN